MSDINRRALAAAISREREANRDWSKAAKEYRKRIAELEAALSQSMGDHVDTGRALRLERAENQRLRAGLSEALDWNWLDDDAPDDSHLRALLGGGEK